MSRLRRAFGVLGPGLITGAADDDPAGMVAATQVGAQFQFAFAWIALIQFPLLAALQIMVSRIGLLTGRDFTRVLGEEYSRALLWVACVLLVVANTFTAGADIAGIGAATELVTGLRAHWVSGVAAAALAITLVFGHYPTIAGVLKWLTISLLGYVVAAILARPDWSSVLHHTAVPKIIPSRDYVALVVALFGGTISPYMLVWQSAEEVEEERASQHTPLGQRPRAAPRDLGRMMTDTIAGMAISQIIAYFAIVAAGAAIFSQGVHHIESARDAAMALRAVGSGTGEIVFAIAIIGTGLLAVPTLVASSAYAVASAGRWPASINAPATKAKCFYVVLLLGLAAGAGIAVFGGNPMHLLIASQVLNGILAAPLLVMILVISNNRRLLGTHTNGMVLNTLGVVALLCMAVPAAWLLVLSIR